ncbi:MAG TPA: HNH endonuclease signature motif containing protein [Solirubrobacteraceae bacterium]|nr:HNH endonuclease signature motif containing protein [Solirubrobacteraceae bacterium]
MTARDSRRRFTARERAALFVAAAGHCPRCGGSLSPDFHADHCDPWVRGGVTDVINGQALCPTCSRRKGDRLTTTTAPLAGLHQAESSDGTAGAVSSDSRRNHACTHEPAGAGHDDAPECHKETFS